jgi:starvation-inducible outer membrane lipoprotein
MKKVSAIYYLVLGFVLAGCPAGTTDGGNDTYITISGTTNERVDGKIAVLHYTSSQ